MQGASDELRPLLDAAVFGEAAVPLVSNVDARPRTSGAEIRAALARQMTGAVQWEASIRRMAADGVDRFVEVGPGKVLAGLIRRIAKDARVDSAGTVDEIAALT
jgi:[acyl-carrier-protein] S-malonyltransferase